MLARPHHFWNKVRLLPTGGNIYLHAGRRHCRRCKTMAQVESRARMKREAVA